MKKYVSLLMVVLYTASYAQERKVNTDFELELEAEYRYFPEKGAFEGQNISL